MQSEESNTLVKLAKAVIEHAPEGADAFWDIKFSDIEAALSAVAPPIRLPTALSLMIEKGVDPEQNGYCRVIDVEKFLCAKLGKEWSATGMSIVSLVDELAALSAQVQDVADSPAIKAIAAERRRQIEKEGWSPDHDDAHCDGSIALAAACYAMFAAVSDNARRSTQLPVSLTNDGQAVEGWAAFLSIWPWERHFWKPTTRVRDLEKAGALIAAELDRVIRAAAPAKQEG